MSETLHPPTYEDACKITLATLNSTLWLHGFASDPEKVVELSLTDPKYFKMLKDKIANAIIQQEPLPAIYSLWLYGFLTEEISPPKRKAGRQFEPHKAEMVVDLVKDLVARGMQATRNDVSNHKNTACDVVADTLKSLGRDPQSYSSVKKIWQSNKDDPNLPYV